MRKAQYYVNQKQFQSYILEFIDKNVTEQLLSKLGSPSPSSTQLGKEFKKGFIQGMLLASMLTCKVETACIEINDEEEEE